MFAMHKISMNYTVFQKFGHKQKFFLRYFSQKKLCMINVAASFETQNATFKIHISLLVYMGDAII